MQGIFKWGGIAASVILILFAIGSIGAGIYGIHYTRDQLKKEQITGSPDMTPSAIKTEAQQAGLTNVDFPTCSVAGEKVDTGQEAATWTRMGSRRRTPPRRRRTPPPVPRFRTTRVTSGSPTRRSLRRSTRRSSQRRSECSGS